MTPPGDEYFWTTNIRRRRRNGNLNEFYFLATRLQNCPDFGCAICYFMPLYQFQIEYKYILRISSKDWKVLRENNAIPKRLITMFIILMHLFIIYLFTLSIAQTIQRWNTRWFVTGELERLQKELLWPTLRCYTGTCPEGLTKTTKNLSHGRWFPG